MKPNMLDISTIFTSTQRTNLPWNMSEYKPVSQYLDPRRINRQKTLKDRKYVRPIQQAALNINQKTFFIDQVIKPIKNNPSPDKYKSTSIFDQTKNRQKSKTIKVNLSASKYTYLDWIQTKSKKSKSPGVGKYNLTKTDKQIKAHINYLSTKHHSFEEKRHFYDGNQTNEVPGVGAYNPHFSVQLPFKPNQKNHTYWIKKHEQLAKTQRKKKRKQLAPNSYRPISSYFNSFEKIQLQSEKQQKNPRKKKSNSKIGFATSEARFNSKKQKKNLNIQKRPSPASYNTMIEWIGKNDEPTKKNWTRCLSAGPTKRIYN